MPEQGGFARLPEAPEEETFLRFPTMSRPLDHNERELNPFDMVIQRGTNHAWEVLGDEPALLMAVLVDREFKETSG